MMVVSEGPLAEKRVLVVEDEFLVGQMAQSR
jgi:hypothetical protein